MDSNRGNAQPQSWSEDEVRLLLEMKATGSTWNEIGRALGRSSESCRSHHKRLRRSGKQEATSRETALTGGATVLEAWSANKRAVGWREIVAHMRRGAKLQSEMRPVHTTATRRIRSDRDVFVVSMADFHLGSPATDYVSFVETTELLLGDERFYLVIVGPDLETAFTWFHSAEAVLNQTAPPWMQLEAYRLWLDEMLPRTLAVTGDNHTDRRLERHLGDIGLTWRDDLPYFRTYGLLTVEMDGGREEPIVYRLALKHQYKGHSIYHNLQPALRVFRDIDPTADVYITAHTHRPAHLSGVFYPEARPQNPVQHFIVNGTFKTGDDIYSLDAHGGRGVLGLPTLRLSPHKHRILFYDSPQDALESTT